MVRGRLIHSWDHTSTLWAVIANTVRDPEQKPDPYTSYDVHPYRDPPETLATNDESSTSSFWHRVNQIRAIATEEGKVAALGSMMRK